MAFGRGRASPLPIKSPHIGSSSSSTTAAFFRRSPSPAAGTFDRVSVASLLSYARKLLWVVAGLVALFLLFSSHSPVSRIASASNPNGFPSKGLKRELWAYINSVPWRELHLDVVETPWRTESSPEQPVPWVTTDLFAIPEATTEAADSPASRLRDAKAASVDTKVESVPRHRIEVYPRVVELPRTAPRLDRLMFGIVTTVERAKMMSVLWDRWLLPRGESEDGSLGPACMVLVSDEERDEEVVALRELLKEKGLQCAVKTSQHDRYEVRVLSMTVEMRDYAQSIARSFDWYIFNDDDTFWLDQRTLRRLLAKYDPKEDWYIGATSEAKNQLESFGRMAFGGAGLLVSDTLLLKLYNSWDTCWANWKHIFGGDEMITRCAAMVLGKTKQTVTTWEPSMHQFDIPGDTTGVFQSGLPFLNLHHYIGGNWVHLFGYGSYRSDLSQIQLLKRVLDFLGGDNLFKRYVFGDGRWLLTQGYSITVFEVPLRRDQLSRVEHTWYSEYRLTLKDRPVVPERHEWDGSAVKQTFYIDDLEDLGDGNAILTYAMADKWDEHLSSAERVRIKVYWNASTSTGSVGGDRPPRQPLEPRAIAGQDEQGRASRRRSGPVTR